MTPYQDLAHRFHRLLNLEDAATFLQWDLDTMMPRGGVAARTEQLTALKLVCHELLVDPRVGELLEGAEAQGDLGAWEQANLREMRRRWIHATALPADLVAALARALPACELTWRSARPANDFAALEPRLAEVLSLMRHVAAAKAERLGCSPYEALLDEHEPGAREERIDTLFDELARFLPGFLGEVLERQEREPDPAIPAGPFPIAQQRALSERLMGIVGFDFERGRLDVSAHPFSTGVREDVRITTRYSEDDFSESLMGTLHETGHALYELGLPEAWRDQPVGRARGMALHESQSLLVEMQVCRGREFLGFAAPLLREAFGGEGPSWKTDNLYRLATRVEPGFIRVDADEVTYPAHVILRYRLERALVAGDLEMAQLPGAWNDGMDELLGIRPPDDRRGCLQDVHWPVGAWGYFPTYTLGALTAAQLYAAAREQRPEIPAAISRGDFAPLRGWLVEHVHGLASWVASTDELLERATGSALSAAAYRSHLRGRYLEA